MLFNNEILYSILMSMISGLAGVLIGSIITWCIHIDSKKMWRNEIFVKNMQEKLVKFHFCLYENIKNDYDSSLLSSLLDNEFDFNSIEFATFFKDKLKLAKELEEQFIFIWPYLKKCLRIRKQELLKLFIYLNTSSLIYGFFVSIQETLSLRIGPDIDDYFKINYNQELNKKEIENMSLSTQTELQEKFKLHINTGKIILSKENQKTLETLKEDVFHYRIYLSEIREKLYKLNKIISDYMQKEL